MRIHDTRKVRNVGIGAHIDAGKTTLAERILFATGRIRQVREVHDGGATTDSMKAEQAHGISIQSAATSCTWGDHHINFIDTPGHMDFTVEVERALRVLDGAVLLLCAVGGVQAQTVTVFRQMARYNVARLAFINKCDRPGADPAAVVAQVRARLGLAASLVQLPLVEDGVFCGVIDIISRQALRFAGVAGEQVTAAPVPAAQAAAVEAAREALLEAVCDFHDGLFVALVEGRPVPEALIHEAIRRGVACRGFVPVLLGSAYHNIGVQPLRDAMVRYLPDPTQATVAAADADGASVPLVPSGAGEPVGFVFKVQETAHGALSWVRLYQGTIRSGDALWAIQAQRTLRVGRLGRLHADRLEPLEQAEAGDIVALFGLGCASGETLTGGSRLAVAGMHVPEPVIEVAARLTAGRLERLSAGLGRYCREDPTLRAYTDPESGELRLKGMGELHLQIYAERLEEEYGCAVALGAPKVSLRQGIARRVDFDFRLRVQTGGPGQFAHLIGYLEPCAADFEFDWQVTGGAIPGAYRDAIRSGFAEQLSSRAEVPVQGVRVVILDGSTHAVDSSERSFERAARAVVREYLPQAEPFLLEPVMRVEAEAEAEQQGALLRTLLTRRGRILQAEVQGAIAHVEAEVPLAEMFGYATALRSATGGAGGFSMEFVRYAPQPG